MWVPWMSICFDEFWIIVSITQFSDFWVMSYGNWKHILGVFSFQNLVFNGIFVIKSAYLAAMFDKWIFFFFWWNPATMFDKFFDFFFFFFWGNQPQLLKLKTGCDLRCQLGDLENLGILSGKWWKLSNEN